MSDKPAPAAPVKKSEPQPKPSQSTEETQEAKENTDKWAHAQVKSTDEAQPASPSAENEKDAPPAPDASSQFSYNELFHAAAVASSNEYDKSFEQLQQEDLAEAQAKHAEAEQQ